MSFEQFDLDTRILKAIQQCGYHTPTPIQKSCIPEILTGKDIVASAPTGTGKTAAFIIPSLQRLSQTPTHKKPRILILTPTRELATQITKASSSYGKFLSFQSTHIVGGMPYKQQLKALSRTVDMVIATPGRLLDHLENRRIDLSKLEQIVLDEADRMLDMGFIQDVKTILRAAPKNCQRLLFSATIDNNLSSIIRELLQDPIRVEISKDKTIPSLIQQKYYMAKNPSQKTSIFYHLLQHENIFKGIVFSATKRNADKLSHDLCEMGFKAAALHGDLKQNQRFRLIEQFEKDKIQFLIATDVAARGIDVKNLTHIINYDLPKFHEDYVHRIGRTGRAGNTGIAISLALPSDKRHIERIERYTRQRITQEHIVGLESSKENTVQSKPKRSEKDTQRDENFTSHKDKPRRTEKSSKFASKFDDSEPTYKNKRFSEKKDKKYIAEKETRYPSKRNERDVPPKEGRTFSKKDNKFSDYKETRYSPKWNERDAIQKEERSFSKKDKKFSDHQETRYSPKRKERDATQKGERSFSKKDKKFSDHQETRYSPKWNDRDATQKGERSFSKKEKKFSDHKETRYSPKRNDRDATQKVERSFSNKDKKYSTVNDTKSFSKKDNRDTDRKDRKYFSKKDEKFTVQKKSHKRFRA